MSPYCVAVCTFTENTAESKKSDMFDIGTVKQGNTTKEQNENTKEIQKPDDPNTGEVGVCHDSVRFLLFLCRALTCFFLCEHLDLHGIKKKTHHTTMADIWENPLIDSE